MVHNRMQKVQKEKYPWIYSAIHMFAARFAINLNQTTHLMAWPNSNLDIYDLKNACRLNE